MKHIPKFCLVSLLIGVAHAQAPGEPAQSAQPVKPRVLALVAAFGEQLSLVYEVQSTGSHISPYRRYTSTANDDVLNRLVLHGLDEAIAKFDPNSKRIYLSLPPAQMDRVRPSEREAVAISSVVAALEKMPERQEWDRIVVATPAYRALGLHGLAGNLQGFGLFAQPLCQEGCALYEMNPAANLGAAGVDAVTSDNETIRARTYRAPFSYVAVWILDPKTLAVLDMQEQFDSQKLAEPTYRAPLDDDADHKYLVGRLSNLIEFSVGQAVTHSEINYRRGTVEVGEPRVVSPDDERK